MTVVLALDCATTSGYAVGRVGATPEWGARDFAGKGGNGEVISKFRHWLNALCFASKPGLVVYESIYIPVAKTRFVRVGATPDSSRGSPPMNAKTIERLCGFVCEVQAVAWELRIECREARPAEIAKFFLGNARQGSREAKKAATIRMCGFYGCPTVSDDAADALSLWFLAEHTIAPQIGSRRSASARRELSLHGTLANPKRNTATPATARGAPKLPTDEDASIGQDKSLFTEIRGEFQPGTG